MTENKQSSEIIEVEDINHVVPLQDEATILISQAIEKNVPVETMERLLAMRRELRAEKSKEEYDRAMAAFQAECPTIEKTKEVYTNGGALAYKYAPIESIVAQVKEALKNNGFSYSTNMVLLDNGVKVLVKVTHAAGHSEVTEMEVPLGTKTGIMSQTQVVAAATTFAKRYAFCNALGILTGDEDDDANSVPKTSEKPSYTPKNSVKTASDEGVQPQERVATKGQLALIDNKMKILGRKQEWLDQVVEMANKKSLEEISFTTAQAVIERLDGAIAKKATS